MTDRELLDLAAKAAGLIVNRARQEMRDADGCGDVGLWIDGVSTCWNPLADDGDALRLAVALGICAAPGSNSGSHQSKFAVATGDSGEILEERRTGPYAATRRAIVRAAAEIGKTP